MNKARNFSHPLDLNLCKRSYVDVLTQGDVMTHDIKIGVHFYS